VFRAGVPARGGAALVAGAGLLTARALGADPVPAGLGAALVSGLLAGGIMLVIALAVMMGTARRPLTEAWRMLRAPERTDPPGGGAPRPPRPERTPDRQEVHRD
jgi:putative peptidoglycan lipid II flippase